MNVVIVESPAKAKTINKYLGQDYKVIASYGHIRDLPAKDGSVKPDEDFTMVYEVNDKAKTRIKSIAESTKKAEIIYLATDPDREGEAISWHIAEVLRDQKAMKKNALVKRIAFNEITKKAVQEAIKNPRDLDMNLVNAQQARRALDYLVGFTLSPVLWRKLPGSKSAGRVQSVSLRLICDREEEIERFVTREYWDIKLDLITTKQEIITAHLTHINGKKLDKFALENEKVAQEIVSKLKNKLYIVTNIEKKQIKRNPPPPFTTSSLQQEAAKKLGFSPDYTMQLAQKLYEGVNIDNDTIGLITYMRTDGVQLSEEAVQSTRAMIADKFGKNYLPKSARIYKTKAKNVQEAHEAIRPTHIQMGPDTVRPFLDKNMHALYELIWKRMVACQMEAAVLDQLVVVIDTDDKYGTLRASGSLISFDGFYKLYRETIEHDTSEGDEDDENRILPEVKIGENLKLQAIKPAQHFTEPPPRYSEASLIKKMEELGIGRPSTYAPIISILQQRNYVRLEKKRFIAEERGRLVTVFLASFFKRYVEYDFTAHMENELDQVSDGKLEWKKLLRNFWQDFEKNITEVKNFDMKTIIETIGNLLDYHFFPPSADGHDNHKCPLCASGRLSMKLGKFGVFLACSNYPECHYTKNIGEHQGGDETQDEAEANKFNEQILGTDPETGLEVSLRKGPYGFYVQLGEAGSGKNKKPKRAAVPGFIEIEQINLEKAIALLNLPREIGKHPETKKMISTGISKFGSYLLHDGKYTSLSPQEDILSLGLNRAVTLIADKAERKSGQKTEKKVLGLHPDDNTELAIYSGRYGPYIKYHKLNVPLGKKINPETVTLEEVVRIIEEYRLKKAAQ